MTFNDIFKSSFLENVSLFQPLDILIALGLSFVLGLFISVVYRKNFSGVMYSNGFALSLVAMSMITTLIILTISSNVVLSLGMVGALSIVRFRTAVKDPMDIVYLFWAISVGIVLGAGMIPMAVLASLFIGVVITFLAGKKHEDRPYLMIVSGELQLAENELLEYLRSKVKKPMVKSKTVSEAGIEITYEVRLIDQKTSFIQELSKMEGVKTVALVSYNGEYLV
ncbi:MAG: DUF4956 domain-containing protein [Clostridia bacterium]|jgi:uncharacterized membrane protein YhiD involved in acid resistance|nr:DUF4956 domain-containing protein [Clostridia bacterium]